MKNIKYLKESFVIPITLIVFLIIGGIYLFLNKKQDILYINHGNNIEHVLETTETFDKLSDYNSKYNSFKKNSTKQDNIVYCKIGAVVQNPIYSYKFIEEYKYKNICDVQGLSKETLNSCRVGGTYQIVDNVYCKGVYNNDDLISSIVYLKKNEDCDPKSKIKICEQGLECRYPCGIEGCPSFKCLSEYEPLRQ